MAPGLLIKSVVQLTCDGRGNCMDGCNRQYGVQRSDLCPGEPEMNIDFDKSQPAMNMADKRGLYAGFVRVSMISTVLLFLLCFGMFVFLT